MTEYYVYSPLGECLGIVENDTSIQWRQRFDESGQFEIHLLFSEDYKEKYKHGNMIVSDYDFSVGFIESIQYRRNEIELRGHLDNLDDFLNIQTFHLKNVGQLIDLANANVRGRNLYPQSTNINIPIDVDTTWKTLRDTFEEQCQLNRCGYSMSFDDDTNHLSLTIQEARFNDNVAFDESLKNMIIDKLFEDVSKEKNYAYVAGEGEGSARTIVEVDLSNGGHKKEMYVDAREIRKKYTTEDKKEHEYTEEEYANLLRSKGLAKLSKNSMKHEYDVDVDEYSESCVFGEDYRRGDIVLVKSKKLNFDGYFLVAETNRIKQCGEKLQVIFRYMGGVEDAKLLSL